MSTNLDVDKIIREASWEKALSDMKMFIEDMVLKGDLNEEQIEHLTIKVRYWFAIAAQRGRRLTADAFAEQARKAMREMSESSKHFGCGETSATSESRSAQL